MRDESRAIHHQSDSQLSFICAEQFFSSAEKEEKILIEKR
jgi:hypothetical protein